jgi:16S rRNA (adenine1518-N6/adenine1519-N6)-dimethyltransferase
MLRAKKSLGQNFLVDENVIARIVREFAPRADETVVEIGAGRGALTAQLVRSVGRLFAVEFDRDLASMLQERFGLHENFTLVQDDALDIDFCAVVTPATSARVVANLPYNISTAILQRLIAQRACISEMVLMLQREVVERITAPPGSSERGYFSVLVEAYCEAEPLFDVAPAAFRPVPKVWSTVVRLRLRERLTATTDHALLWQTVSAGFAQRRKTILNNLRGAPEALRERIEERGGASSVLAVAEVEPQRRAETLTLEEWSRLAFALGGGA